MERKIEELKRKISELENKLEETQKSTKSDIKPKESFAPNKVLLKWESPARVFVKRNKVWYLKVAVIALLLILFFAFLQDFVVILVICVIVLIAFLLASIPPESVKHSVTNKGIYSIDQLYKWSDLKHFRVNKKNDFLILNIRTTLRFPPRLELLIDPSDEEKIIKLVGNRIEYEEIPEKQGWISKMTDGEIIRPERYYKLFSKDGFKAKSKKLNKK
ncbi:MAG: DUF5673 domain-containing protein [Candidatus Dojkabacteria bacterium]|jgi:hypothetical protein|nr:DUF5673 domain-containing protein [Candidatus Dojkabacteria bacterium]